MRPGGQRPVGSGAVAAAAADSEARPDSATRSGNTPHRSRGRRGDGDLGALPRDDGNRTLNEELAVTRCRMSKEELVVMKYQSHKEE
jgi:hypothetical protein